MIKITLLNRRHGVHPHVWIGYTRTFICELCNNPYTSRKHLATWNGIKPLCRDCLGIFIQAKIDLKRSSLPYEIFKQYIINKTSEVK